MYYNFQAARTNLYRVLILCILLTLVAAVLSERTKSASADTKRIVAASETTTIVSTAVETTLVTEAATTQAAQVITQTSVVTPTTIQVLPNPCKYDNTVRYTIVAGDVLYNIADRYNTGIYEIVGCNQWQDNLSHLILPGDIIILPPTAHLTVVTTTTTVPPTTLPPAPVVTQPPAPPPPPPAPPAAGRRTHPDCWWEPWIRGAFANAGASVNTQDFFVFVAWRESRCTQTAHNGDRSTGDDSYGLFQINMLPKALGPLMTSWGYTGQMLLDGGTNIQATVRLWQHVGTCAWIKPNYCS